MSLIPGECPTLELVELPRQCGQTNAGANRIVNGEHCEDWEHSLGSVLRNYEILGSVLRRKKLWDSWKVSRRDWMPGRGLLLWATTTPTQVELDISSFPFFSKSWWPAPWTETNLLISSNPQGNSATSADRLLSPTSMWFVSHLLHNLQHCIVIEISTDKNCFHVWRTKVWPLL